MKIVHGLDPDARNLEDDVTTNDDLLTADGGRAVAAEHAGIPGGRALGHGLDEVADPARHVEDLGELAGQQRALEPGPDGFLLQEQLASRLHRHHEPESLAAPRLRDDVADDADDL